MFKYFVLKDENSYGREAPTIAALQLADAPP